MQNDILSFTLFVLPFAIAYYIGLWKVFEKSGRKGWEAIVPIYNYFIWLKIVKKPVWWIIFTVIPFLNILVTLMLVLEMVKCFGKKRALIQLFAVIFPYIYLPIIGFKKSEEFLGPISKENPKNKPLQKTPLQEWMDAIIFAGGAALIIRALMIEAFMIPTSSMERTLMVGDFLFVSKINYGSRLPMLPISFPFVHNKMPFTEGTKSYSDIIKLPYFRLPGFEDVERNDIVVFNYPADDIMPNNPVLGPVNVTSAKENYIKRCVGVSGDKIEVKNSILYVNDKIAFQAENMQYKYLVKTTETGFNFKMLEKYGFRKPVQGEINMNWGPVGPNTYEFFMPESIAKMMKKWSNVLSVQKIIEPKNTAEQGVFPNDLENFPFNSDNFGPIIIPKKGETVQINKSNIALYKRVIETYEGHDLKMDSKNIYIDGQKVDSYTFEMNYYWMMGDNRKNSLDSRYWGYVPEDHIVGKPLMVFASFENGLRWDRLFKFVD